MPPKKAEAPLPPLKGTPVKPSMFCADVWHRDAFDQVKMNAYKEMEYEGQIRLGKITYSKLNQMVVIEYWSAMPHQWVLDDLKKKVCPEEKKAQQLSMM